MDSLIKELIGLRMFAYAKIIKEEINNGVHWYDADQKANEKLSHIDAIIKKHIINSTILNRYEKVFN